MDKSWLTNHDYQTLESITASVSIIWRDPDFFYKLTSDFMFPEVEPHIQNQKQSMVNSTK